jgi:alpha-beta hydrolase superfamily lysophospholipase
MIRSVTKFLLTTTGIFGLIQAFGADVYPFFLERQDGSVLEGYFTPPSNRDLPIVFAIQGSSCESVSQWHLSLSDQANALGLGVIALEKQGVSQRGIDLLEYHQTNCLQQRQEDYALCLKNMSLICPDWEGKTIFWGESEGGMIASSLARQTPNTAAVLLFGAGGGMKPREEVKWALNQRLQQQRAEQEEIEEYMQFLDAQMDMMINDPDADKQFLGNTYKWWASFLNAEEGALPLNQQSLPICLVHGVEDFKIPVQSADLAAEMLSKTNTLTYLRLEGYGHHLYSADVEDATYRWLEAILFGGEPISDEIIAQAQTFTSISSQNTQTSLSEYIFSRGRDRDNDSESRNDVSGGVKGGRDSEGNERASAEGTYSHDFGNGWDLEVSGGAGFSRDKDGNTRSDVHGEVRVNGSF